jgi:hypothetical protein
MRIPIPKCPVCNKIGKYQKSGLDYTVLVCDGCDISYSVGGTIPDHIPESQIKLWIRISNEKTNESKN